MTKTKRKNRKSKTKTKKRMPPKSMKMGSSLRLKLTEIKELKKRPVRIYRHFIKMLLF